VEKIEHRRIISIHSKSVKMLIDNDDLRQLHTAILSPFGLAKDRRLQCVHVHSNPAPGGVLKRSLSRYGVGCDDRQRFTLKVSVSFLTPFILPKWPNGGKLQKISHSIMRAKMPF
jgi:hypothetical protein